MGCGSWSHHSRGCGAHQVSADSDSATLEKISTDKRLLLPVGCMGEELNTGIMVAVPSSHPETIQLSLSLYVSGTSYFIFLCSNQHESWESVSPCGGHLRRHLGFQQLSVSPWLTESPMIFIAGFCEYSFSWHWNHGLESGAPWFSVGTSAVKVSFLILISHT